MAVPSFSIAVGTYGLTEAIKNGDARSQKFSLQPVEVTPGVWRTFGTEDQTFWCSTGSGVEEYSKLNDSI